MRYAHKIKSTIGKSFKHKTQCLRTFTQFLVFMTQINIVITP
jgi:hypothetical protein